VGGENFPSRSDRTQRTLVRPWRKQRPRPSNGQGATPTARFAGRELLDSIGTLSRMAAALGMADDVPDQASVEIWRAWGWVLVGCPPCVHAAPLRRHLGRQVSLARVVASGGDGRPGCTRLAQWSPGYLAGTDCRPHAAWYWLPHPSYEVPGKQTIDPPAAIQSIRKAPRTPQSRRMTPGNSRVSVGRHSASEGALSRPLWKSVH
jgi:hypothetical protein